MWKTYKFLCSKVKMKWGISMSKLFYCEKCKRVIENFNQCDYCKTSDIKELKVGTSVNILGTKQKGKVFKIDNDKVKLIVIDEAKNRLIKEYEAVQLKKVL